MECKKCTKCGEIKQLDDYRRNKNTPDGREYQCRDCRKAIGKVGDRKASRVAKKKEWIDVNRELYNSYIKKWQKNNPEFYKECLNKYENENREKRWFDNVRYRVIRKHGYFNLKFEDIKIPRKCPILGIPMEFSIYNGNEKKHLFWDNTPSLDRIDNNKGYEKDNVWVISRLANTMKNKGSFEDLYKFSKFFSKNIKKVNGEYIFKYNNDSYTDT